MTRYQQQVLTDAIRTAAENQGIKQAELARVAGTSAGNVSYAMACKSTMSEEKWRLICEHVGVDFDEVMRFPPQEEAQKILSEPIVDAAALAAELEGGKPGEPEVIPVVLAAAFSAAECQIIKELIEAHLVADLQKNGADFGYLKAVFEIHAKCERVEKAG